MECNTDLERIEIPNEAQSATVQTLFELLSNVTDRRSNRGKRYSVGVVLTLLLLAKMSGQKKVSGIAQWARLRIEWLRTQLNIEREQLPCGNTYQYVCDHIDVDELNQRLADFFASQSLPKQAETPPKTHDEKASAPEQPLQHWVTDGKSLRGTHRPTQGQPARSVLTLYDLSKKRVVAQREMAGKGHERATALAVVKEQDLKGVLLGADALHTQTTWCENVREKGGHYLLIAKANQRLLRADIALLFSEPPRPWLPEQGDSQKVYGHGQIVKRSLRASCELNDYLAPKWPDVAQVFQLIRQTTKPNRTTTEVVYGLTSLPPDMVSPLRLINLIRDYWMIENRLHWRRDVTLGEDGCTVRRQQTPLVLATINNLILSLVDRLGVKNLAAQQRIFEARPQYAIDLILHPL